MNTVQEIINCYRAKNPGTRHAVQVEKVFTHMQQCGTLDMGYHHYRCTHKGCTYSKMQYHSCHDRHCPRCGSQRSDEWVEDRGRDLLPCVYYHVVFTVPHELNSIFLGNMKVTYDLLFKSVSETLLDFAGNPRYLGAVPGIITVLHTWGQNLSYHPHLHCIITGGGMRRNRSWKQLPFRGDGFLFPVKALRKKYRGKLLDFLQQAIIGKTIRLHPSLNWHRLKTQLCFVKIRQYGIWAYREKSKRIGDLLLNMNLPSPPLPVVIPFYLRLMEKTGIDIFRCPVCKNRTLEIARVVYRSRAPV